MFSELLKSVSDQYTNCLPFVVYRKPNEGLVQALLQEDTRLHYVKDYSEKGFVFAPFDYSKQAVLLAIKTKLQANYKANLQVPLEVADFPFGNSQKDFHLDLVKKGIAQIEKDVFKKVVLSRKITTVCETEPVALFQKLLDTYTSAFCYLWYHPKVGTWLGATPEILLKKENRQFTTMSLAGTKKYIEYEDPDWGSKELEEQQLVTDYISDSLRAKVSNLQISQRESIRAGHLWHLRTKITGHVENETLASCIKALHPTPAVCGMPMLETKNFILENENYDREFYTGYLGELNFTETKDRSSNTRNQENKAYRSVKTTTTLFVNLRCFQLKNSQAQVYVGGGITQDSDPEKEWQETVAKSRTMLQITGKN